VLVYTEMKKHYKKTQRIAGQKKGGKRQETSFTYEAVIKTTSKGIGFTQHPTNKNISVRIEKKNLNTALNGDRVVVILTQDRFQDDFLGRVITVQHRAKTKFVGTVRRENGVMLFYPDDRNAYTPFKLIDPILCKHDDKVFVELRKWNNKNSYPEADIIEIIGKKGLHEVEIRSITLENNIDDTFPKEVENEALYVYSNYEKYSNITNRRDFRGTPTFSIDPSDAKDFDDALSISYLSDGTLEVGIHIADVSFFVTPGSVLDQEAQKRGFSSYLVDRTIPMLPEILSNDLCSLKQDVDRYTYSIWFNMTPEGKILSHDFGRSIIRSQKRFTYDEAQKILDAKSGIFFKELNSLNVIAKKYRAKRMKRGAIDFEQHEVHFELADDGVPLYAYLKERLDTHKLIEEFMLLANQQIANYIYSKYGKKKHPFMYRVHDAPNSERIRDLAEFSKALGHPIKFSQRGYITGRSLNTLFTNVAGTPEESLILTAGLRSMAKAEYTTRNIGHFGLALSAYAQFTSPIRRYPDILVHRLLEHDRLYGTLPFESYSMYETLSNTLSQRELSIIDAERESIKLKQAEYMSARIGKEFYGVISGVSDWGFFVEERDTHAEGLIRLSNMHNDYYIHEPKKYRIIGKRTKTVFSLGDEVRFRVINVDVDKKLIDCSIV